MFLRLDEAILEWTERQSHRVQRLVGLTNFVLARIMLIGALACLVGAATQTTAPAWPLVGAVASFLWLYLLMHWDWYAMVEAHYLNGSDTAHPYTLMWRAQGGARLTNILLTVCAMGAALFAQEPIALRMNFALAMPLWLAALYLQCVIPLPPGTSKLRDFLESLRPHPPMQPVPTRR